MMTEDFFVRCFVRFMVRTLSVLGVNHTLGNDIYDTTNRWGWREIYVPGVISPGTFPYVGARAAAPVTFNCATFEGASAGGIDKFW